MNEIDIVDTAAYILMYIGASIVCYSLFDFTWKAVSIALGITIFAYPAMIALIRIAHRLK